MSSAPRDENRIAGLVAKSDADNTPVVVEADPITKRLKTNATITGTVSTGGLTDTELRATPVPISYPDTVVTGTLTNVNDVVEIDIPPGYNSVGIALSGTFTGITVVPQEKVDNARGYDTCTMLSVGGSTPITSTAAAGTFQALCGGMTKFQVKLSAISTGSVAVTLRASRALTSVMLDNPIPAGSNTIGSVGINGGSNNIGSVNMRDTSGDTLDSSSSALWVNPRNSSGVEISPSTSTAQTDGTQKSQIVDAGGEAATVTGGKLDVNASVDTTGLATSAKQDIGNTSLSSIDTKLTSQATAANQTTELTRLGDVAETAPATDTASSGLNGRLQRIAQRLTSLIALLPGSLGQKARASSFAVTLSTEDITALTPPAAITGYATSAKQDTLLTELQLKADLTETQPVSLASVPLPSGAATSAAQTTAQTSLNTVTTDLDYRYSGGKTAYVGTINTSGNHDAITPASGNRIRVFWAAFVPNSDNAAANLFKLGFGTTAGSISTEIYRGYAMAHWEVFTGTANQSVIINTATAEPVAVTIHYQEIT